jgi:hypothetical protein
MRGMNEQIDRDEKRSKAALDAATKGSARAASLIPLPRM